MDINVKKMLFDEYFESYYDEMVSSLRGLIEIESTNGNSVDGKPFGEGASTALEYIKNLSESFGLTARNFDNYVVTADYSDGDAKLGILAHVDVVPAGEGWSFEPFKLTESDGVLYGRGTIDDKGPAIAALYAAKAIKELEIPISSNFRYIFGSDEEQGGSDIQHYQSIEKFPELLLTPDGSFPIVNAEKGMAHVIFEGSKPDCDDKLVSFASGTAVNAVPATATAVLTLTSIDAVLDAIGMLSTTVHFQLEQNDNVLTIIATGKSSHGSRPERGDNALTALLSLLDNLGISIAHDLCKLFKHGEFFGEGFGIECEDEISGKLTLALTVCNIADNRMEIGLDCRFPISKASADIMPVIFGELEKLDLKVKQSDIMEPHYVDENSEFIQKLKEVYSLVTGYDAECLCEGGVTYVHNTKGGVAFGAEFAWENNNMHSADEHISKETFLANAKAYALAISELCK